MNPGELSQTTQSLKWASLGVTSFAIFVGTWLAASDQSGPIYRYAARYTASLERKLRPMFIFVPGRHIAYGQCAAAFMRGLPSGRAGAAASRAWAPAACPGSSRCRTSTDIRP